MTTGIVDRETSIKSPISQSEKESLRREHHPLKITQRNITFLNFKLILLAVAKYFAMLSFNYVFLALAFVHLVTAKVWLGMLPSNENEKKFS